MRLARKGSGLALRHERKSFTGEKFKIAPPQTILSDGEASRDAGSARTVGRARTAPDDRNGIGRTMMVAGRAMLAGP